MTDFRITLDSSVWLGYLLGNIPQSKKFVNSNYNLFTSILSIHEIYKRIEKLGKNPKKAIKFVKENSTIINLNEKIAINSVKNCKKYTLHTIDSIIYTCAEENNSLFITLDYDFSRTPNTEILKRK